MAPGKSPDRPKAIFRKLPQGRGGRSPEEVAGNQRARLMGAMVEAVARNGYPATTLRELVALAGVSSRTLYEHFDSIEDCFLATFDEIVSLASEEVGRAYRSKSGFAERLHAAFEAYVERVIAEPAATSLVLVDSLSLGAVGVARRQSAAEAFDLMFRQSFDQAPERGEVSEVTIRAINGGIRGVVYRRVRRGQPEQLRDHLEELVEWGLLYQRPGGASSLRGAVTGPMPAVERAAEGAEGEPGWKEPPDSPRSRTTLSQRERILRAAAKVAGERGFGSLSIPAITAAAGVSNQTFYESFASAPEAFGAALEILAERTLALVAVAIEAEEDWVEGVRAGLGMLLGYLGESPMLARLLFIEVLSAGPIALDRVEVVMDRLTALFNPGAVPAEVGAPPPDVVVEAIGAGIFVVIQNEVAQGRTEGLAELLGEIAFIVLAAFGVE
jgi:AcrR family transcriptional regulator